MIICLSASLPTIWIDYSYDRFGFLEYETVSDTTAALAALQKANVFATREKINHSSARKAKVRFCTASQLDQVCLHLSCSPSTAHVVRNQEHAFLLWG